MELPKAKDAEMEYEKECSKCGCLNSVVTQKDKNSEYYTNIWIQCFECDSWVKFKLPVN